MTYWVIRKAKILKDIWQQKTYLAPRHSLCNGVEVA